MVFHPPNKPLRDELSPKVPKGWEATIPDHIVSLCSAAIILAVRGKDRGMRMVKLYLLAKALRVYLVSVRREKLGPFFPIKWLRKNLRPFFSTKEAFEQAWADAIFAKLLYVFPDSNAVGITPVDSKESWERSFELLGMTPEGTANNRGSFDDIVWTTHTTIVSLYSDVLNTKWTSSRHRAALAAVFMWGLNHNGFSLSLESFGKLLGVSGKTMERWSKLSGEYAQRRCILVHGAKWVPDWKMEDRPEHLRGITKPMMNPETSEFKESIVILNKTKQHGNRGKYIFFRHARKKASRLARRIPNFHMPKGGRKIKTQIPESQEWCTQRKRVLPDQLYSKPMEGDRVWYNSEQMKELRRKALVDRRWGKYNKLSPEKKAAYREEMQGRKIYDDDNIGCWAAGREIQNHRARSEEHLVSLRMRLRKLSEPMFTPKKQGEIDNLVLTDRQMAYVEEKVGKMEAEREEEIKRVKREIRELEATLHQNNLIRKRACLSGPKGEDKFGINTFTTPIFHPWGTLKAEFKKLLPDRAVLRWNRAYSLGHRKIKAKKSAIRCTACKHVIPHHPHPQYHNSCPHCGATFALGVTGMAH